MRYKCLKKPAVCLITRVGGELGSRQEGGGGGVLLRSGGEINRIGVRDRRGRRVFLYVSEMLHCKRKLALFTTLQLCKNVLIGQETVSLWPAPLNDPWKRRSHQKKKKKKKRKKVLVTGNIVITTGA